MRQYDDYLTVFLEWIPEKGVTYNVRTETATVAVNITVTASSAQINVSYNTLYNMSVEVTLCGQKNVSVVEIYFGEFL
jgi:hypothetical protein